jgi:hypothetical protein
MNTLWKPSNTVQPSGSAARSNVQCACWLILGSLLALPVGAVQERNIRELRDPDLNNTGRGVGPVAVVAPIFNPSTPKTPKGVVTQGIGPEKLTPPGAGPAAPQVRVVNTTPPPEPAASARTLPPMSNPSPGTGDAGLPTAAMGVSPPIKGKPGQGSGPVHSGPGPGNGPEKPVMPGASPNPALNPVARVALPYPPTQGAGVSVAATTNPTPNTSAAITLAPAPLVSVDAPIRPQSIPTHSEAPSTSRLSLATPEQQGNRVIEPLLGLNAVASLLPSAAVSTGAIVEILPGAQKLSESMREVPSTRQQGIEKDAIAATNNDKCVSVSLRPDTQRPGLNLVDLTGDGLIVSAVPDAHIQSVFAKAGYGQVDLSQTARWCITQTAARALVRPSSGAGIQQAALLVQTGTGLQLMSQDQWVAHQASVKPLVTAMSASKPSKLNKPAYKLVAKRSSKPTTGVAVSALRLPASTSKTNAGA